MTDDKLVAGELLAVAMFQCEGDRAAAWRGATDEQRLAARKAAETLTQWLEDKGVKLVPRMVRAKVALRDIITVPAHRAYELPVNLD